MSGTTISNLPAAASALLTDLIPVVELGTTNVTKRATLQQVQTALFSGSIPGNLSLAGNLSVAGTITGNTLAATTDITAGGKATITGTMTAGAVTTTGTVTGGALNTSGTMTAGTITATNGTIAGALGANTLNTTNLTVGGAAQINTLQVTGTTTVGTLNSSGTVTAANLTTSGAVNASGTVTGNFIQATNDVVANRNLQVTGTSYTGALQIASDWTFYQDAAGNRVEQFAPGPWYWQFTNSNGFLTWNVAGGTLWSFNTTSNIAGCPIGFVFGNGPYNNISDERAKKDITPALVGLAEVLRLEPIDFVRVIGERHDTGFSAQQVAEIIPTAVNDLGEPGLAVADTPILAALVNGCKELAARVVVLEAALAASTPP